MITKKRLIYFSICFVIAHLFFLSIYGFAQESTEVFTIEKTIENAIKVNLGLKLSEEDTKAAMSVKKSRFTNFLPTLSTRYQFERMDEGSSIGGFATTARDEYSWVTSFTQPIFTGFSLLRQYDLAKLGVDAAKIKEDLQRQDIILNAKTTYFSLLKAKKLRSIAEETVTQIDAQKEVANNFYQVGMSPLNDLLQAQVELANAKQELIVAKNNMENAEANFNTLLRRPINTQVVIKDILDYTSFVKNLDYCLNEAEKNRIEIKVADLEVEIAEKELQLARKDYYPSIDLQGSYFKFGTDWDVDGGAGIFDPSGWTIQTTATWNFWEWGRTKHGVKEKLSRVSQSQLRKDEIRDNIHLEVKKAYLRTQEAEKAIITVEKAIEQAKENFRINQERYKEQVATSTDVLDAQTLLSRTMTNYYNALYEFKISKATLYRAMGEVVMD